MNDIDEYQELCCLTISPRPKNDNIAHFAIGLAEEAGETLGFIKRALYYGQNLDRTGIVKELGDIMWYASALARELGVPMSEVLQVNREKLEKRYPSGKWTAEDAAARKDGG